LNVAPTETEFSQRFEGTFADGGDTIRGLAQLSYDEASVRTLDDQAGTQLRELRQRLPRVLAHPHSEQPIDLLLDLRRRRYCTSHGVSRIARGGVRAR
jgi:hypothetical protein